MCEMSVDQLYTSSHEYIHHRMCEVSVDQLYTLSHEYIHRHMCEMLVDQLYTSSHEYIHCTVLVKRTSGTVGMVWYGIRQFI